MYGALRQLVHITSRQILFIGVHVTTSYYNICKLLTLDTRNQLHDAFNHLRTWNWYNKFHDSISNTNTHETVVVSKKKRLPRSSSNSEAFASGLLEYLGRHVPSIPEANSLFYVPSIKTLYIWSIQLNAPRNY